MFGRQVTAPPPERRSPETIKAAWEGMRGELARWEELIQGEWLAAGVGLSAADVTLFPEVALGRRIAERNPGLVEGALLGPRLAVWMARMEALPVVQRTWPPHWKPAPPAPAP